ARRIEGRIVGRAGQRDLQALSDGILTRPAELGHRAADHHRTRCPHVVALTESPPAQGSNSHRLEVPWRDVLEIHERIELDLLRRLTLNLERPGVADLVPEGPDSRRARGLDSRQRADAFEQGAIE